MDHSSSESDDEVDDVSQDADMRTDSGLISVKVYRGDDDGRHAIYEVQLQLQVIFTILSLTCSKCLAIFQTTLEYSKFYKPIEVKGQYKFYKALSDKIEDIQPKYTERIGKFY
jgi:hypothetical protein